MAEKEPTNPLFSNPLEAYPGLTVSDLNQYLPALENTDDIEMTLGCFVCVCVCVCVFN